MKKSWGLTGKISDGRKKIESRWYKIKHKPWDAIKAGDTVYFKNSGESVSMKAEVGSVMQFSGLNAEKVKDILSEFGSDDGIESKDIPEFFEKFKDKNYCILIFLKNPLKIKSFEIDKKGFGSMAAWVTVKNINSIKI
jgi:ASC-1-like (ASCH) protein